MSITKYDEPGRARKYCPTCQKYVHARVLQCDCSYDFKKEGNVEAPTILSKEDQHERDFVTGVLIECGIPNLKVVMVESGPLPNPPVDGNIEDWFNRVMNHGFSGGKLYSSLALKNMLGVTAGFENKKNMNKLQSIVNKYVEVGFKRRADETITT